MSASTSLQGPSNPSYEFLEGIKAGDLEETLKKYPLQEKSNLAALERLVTDSQDITPKRLLDLVDIVGKMYPRDGEITDKMNALAKHRLFSLAPEEPTVSTGNSNTPLIANSLEDVKAHAEIMRTSMSFNQRITFAQKYIQNDPVLLSEHLFDVLFSSEEIDANPRAFTDLIDCVLAELNFQQSNLNPTDDAYRHLQEKIEHLGLAKEKLEERELTPLTPKEEKARAKELRSSFFPEKAQRDRMVADLMKGIGVWSNASEGAKQQFAQRIKAYHPFLERASPDIMTHIIGGLMGMNRQFVLNYLPDLLIDTNAPLMIRTMSFEQRMVHAQKCLEINPQFLAKNLSVLFTDREIDENLEQFRALRDNLTQKIRNLPTIEFRDNEKISKGLQHFRNVFATLEARRRKPAPSLSDTAAAYQREMSESYREKYQLYVKRLEAGNPKNDKDCHHWECIGEDPDPQNKGCYVFRIKQPYEPMRSGGGWTTAASENIMTLPAAEPEFTTSNLRRYNRKEFALLGVKLEIRASALKSYRR